LYHWFSIPDSRLVANSGQHGHERSHQPWSRSRLAHRGRCRLLRLLHFAAALHRQGLSLSILSSSGFADLRLSADIACASTERSPLHPTSSRRRSANSNQLLLVPTVFPR
jgi:hypothetical protein